MTRRPTFWIIFCALGIAGAVTAIRLFSVAMPSISLDISMDRGSALAEAAALAERYGWAPSDARSAASFGQVGSEVQTYVELEGGGGVEQRPLGRVEVGRAGHLQRTRGCGGPTLAVLKSTDGWCLC